MVVNIWTFLFEVLNFVVLVYVLKRLLYRPLHQAIDQRRALNAQAQAEAEQARQQAAALQQQLAAQLSALDQQRQDVLRQARDQAEAERKATLDEADRALQRRRKEAEEQLAHDRAEAVDSLRGELVASALKLAERFLGEAAGTTLQQQLAERLVAELERTSEDDRLRLRAGWSADEDALVESAAALSPETLQRLAAALAAIAGRTVELTVETHPTLTAGVRVRLGGHVWDATLTSGLDGAAAPATAPATTAESTP